MRAFVPAYGAEAIFKMLMGTLKAASYAYAVLPFFMSAGELFRKIKNAGQQCACKNEEKQSGDSQSKDQFIGSCIVLFHDVPSNLLK